MEPGRLRTILPRPPVILIVKPLGFRQILPRPPQVPVVIPKVEPPEPSPPDQLDQPDLSTNYHTSEEERSRILALRSGLSIGETAKLAKRHRTTIARWEARFNETGTVRKKDCPGRTGFVSEDDRINMLAAIEQNPFKSAKTIAAEAGVEISAQWASKLLKREGFKYSRPQVKFSLGDRCKEARSGYAENYKDYNEDFWVNSVVFSGETTLLSDWVGPQSVSQEVSTRPDDQQIVQSDRSGRFSVRLFAWFSGAVGPSPLQRIDGNFNAHQYVQMLRQELPVMRELLGSQFTYQHDYSTVHTGRIVSDFFREENVNLLTHPGKSPDLNPIEDAWVELKKNINYNMRNADELFAEAERVWNRMTDNIEFWSKLAASMPRKLQACRENGGNILSFDNK